MVYNVLLYIVAGFSINSWILPLYSIVTYGAGLKAIDFFAEGIDRSKAVMITTDKPKEISKALSDAFETGNTILPAIGGYSSQNKSAIYFVVNRFQIYRMRNIVHEIDKYAYMTISQVADVYKSMHS